jgi:Carbohydrate family 9 binding domain-like
MKKLINILLSLLLPASLYSMGFGLLGRPGDRQVQDSSSGSVIIRKCTDFQVKGDGSSDAWNKTEWIKISPQGGNPGLYETKAKVLYSGTGLYFLFRCEDKKLTSTMKADYLNLWEEDVVEVFLWPSEDFPVYFEYEISPMDYELPIIVPNYKGKFLGWLPWNYEGDKRTRHATSVIGGEKKSGASVTAWMTEFFIPYKLLAPLPKVPPQSGTRWRANLYRIDHDNGTAPFAWQKTTRTFHEYDRFGTFIFE